MASAPSNQSATVKTFGDALRLQARVIYALILRETRTTFGDSKIGYLWALLEPIAYLGVFMIIFTTLGRSSPLPVDIPYFFLTGLFPYLAFRKIVQRIMSAKTANQALITYPQVTVFDTQVARLILETCISLIVLLLVLMCLPLMGFTHTQLDSPIQIIFCIMLLTLFSFGVGAINAYIIVYVPAWEKVYNLTINRALFFLSGIFYLPEQIPQPYSEWLMYNPMARFIAWFRDAAFIEFDSTFSYTPAFIFYVISVIFVGLLLQRKGQ